jgi:hypothetical protein
MKHLIYLVILAFFIPATYSCSSAEKAAKERRNLMIPKQGELVKNQKFKPPKTKKTYNHKKKKRR